ncbi:MAG TPA: twin-arginine translocase TatA/TatE family subunit [Candidatus Acidoferrales bacterium]|nr:twin-arginine translocase TatA/TatE family subunit [Candidatus Acidoferrales bacterium]
MLSVPHLIIIFLVALIVFGPEKLPELARKLGRVTAEFKRATDGLRAGFEEHMRELERDARAAEARKQPAENTIGAPRTELPADAVSESPQESSAEKAPGEEGAGTAASEATKTTPAEMITEKANNGDAKPA